MDTCAVGEDVGLSTLLADADVGQEDSMIGDVDDFDEFVVLVVFVVFVIFVVFVVFAV